MNFFFSSFRHILDWTIWALISLDIFHFIISDMFLFLCHIWCQVLVMLVKERLVKTIFIRTLWYQVFLFKKFNWSWIVHVFLPLSVWVLMIVIRLLQMGERLKELRVLFKLFIQKLLLGNFLSFSSFKIVNEVFIWSRRKASDAMSPDGIHTFR